jgi:serine/threonine protein kinase
MAVPTNPEEVLELLRQSELIAETDLALCREEAATALTAEQFANELVRRGLITRFHATNLLKGRWRGFFVGKYRLLELIGAGGMGQVYLAAHKTMRRLVALKLLSLRPGADPSILPRFQREARAMAALDHPHIVKAFDADQDDKIHYIVLEYVDGVSLSELIKQQGPMPVERAANFICQAALGLHHAHQMGIIHRDIKPGNMLLDREGLVKILDMGLARVFHDNADNLTLQHNAGQALGTADYLAPEQATNSHEVDPRADVYALGGTLYYLLMGRAPFQGASTTQKLAWHQLKMPPAIRQQRPEVPAAVEAIVNKMMAKKAEDRFASAEEVREVLDAWAGPTLPPHEKEMRQHCPAVQQLLLPNLPRESFVHRGDRKQSATNIPLVQSNSSPRTPPPIPAPQPPVPPSRVRPAPSSAARKRPRTAEVRRLTDTPGTAHPLRHDTDLSPHGPSRQAARPTTPPTTEADQAFAAYLPGSKTPAPLSSWLRNWWPALLVAGMLVGGTIAGAMWSLAVNGADKEPPTVTASEAANHINKRCTVQLQVQSVGSFKNGPPGIYLHSESDWKQRGNFSVVLSNAAIQRYRDEGVEDFVQHFKDRTIRVTGTIQQQKDRNLKFQRVQTVIDDPASVQVVD